jgi:hypothetical protein
LNDHGLRRTLIRNYSFAGKEITILSQTDQDAKA